MGNKEIFFYFHVYVIIFLPKILGPKTNDRVRERLVSSLLKHLFYLHLIILGNLVCDYLLDKEQYKAFQKLDSYQEDQGR